MQLLGGMTPATFLKEHWQKKPLLVRQAIPGFKGFLSPRDLARLAGRDDAVSRVVKDSGHSDPKKRWRLDHGPFHNLDVGRVPAERWTLLVQNIERFHDEGWPLLQRFNFIPTSRVDDLMVSWAKTGGSVGPHVDAYDVFLLQGSGRRRWQIDDGKDLTVVDADVRVLKSFKPVGDWVLEPGDLLYLPPNIGHHGVSLDDDCMTWSIGFTAPSHEQLLMNWLAFQEQSLADVSGHYEDKDLAPQSDPAALSDATVARVKAVLERVKATDDAVATFAGRLFTGRPDVEFDAPKKPLDKNAFAQRLQQKGRLALAKKSRMLFRGARIFINGEEHTAPPSSSAALATLANTRALPLPANVDVGLAYDLYRRGFVVLL